MKKSTSQTGSAYLVIIIVIVLAVIGALGYVLWNNMNKPKTNNTQTSQNKVATPPAKKSEIIALQNSDMNKYVNYEQGFEFEFPKESYAPSQCMQKDYVENADHSMSRVDSYYIDSYAAGVPITVLESGNRFIITPKNIFILSSYGAPGQAHKCETQSASVDLLDRKNNVDESQYVANTNQLEFDVVPATNENDILAFIHKTLNDDTASIDTMGPLTDGRQAVTMKGGTKNAHETGFAYKLWYYPAQKKLVYIALGQSISFEPTADPNTGGYYDFKIADSFKFSTD